VTPDVGARRGAKADHDGCDKSQDGDADRREKRLSHSDDHISASPFVVRWIAALSARAQAPRRALDVAMGRGRHAVELARSGFRTFGVDAKLDAVRSAMRAAAGQGVFVRGWCADLTMHPLPRSRFELVLVARYLQRDLFPAIREAITPGGFVVYETFTERQRALGVGPTSPDHLLAPGELRERFDGFEVLFYEETAAPEALARIVARKPVSA
jgi:SAM-dependent methyltransferase